MQTLVGCCDDSTYAISNLLPDRKYDVEYAGATPARLRFVLWRGADRWLRLDVPYPVEPTVTRFDSCDLADPDPGSGCKGAARSLPELEAAATSSYYDAATKKLHLKLVATGGDWESLEVSPK